MPLSYDPLQISSSIFFRPEDIMAIDICNKTEASTDDTSVTDTYIDVTSVAIDNITILADEITDNQILSTAGNDVTNLSIPIRIPCSCSLCRTTGNMTIVDLNKFLQDIKSEMLIKKNETSAWTRKMKCAEDPRPSSQGIGLVGSLLLCLALGLVVLIDVSNYCLVLKRRKVRCSNP
ncbi:uncharacterized protein LOC117321586 [Pecten maximus]|uniref:uncharacterized protein LOC117321586 n=1 Tax=Pecten maximus TaxID=6579 RepID=UPI001458C34F|nr:uncharacterized protein LOC117321586 [Pecten maximus]